MGIIRKLFLKTGEHTSYHIDTAFGPVERTIDYLKSAVLKPVVTVIFGTFILTNIVDGSIRYLLASRDAKEKDKPKIIAQSLAKATEDYVSVAKPAGKFIGIAAWEFVKGVSTVLYIIGNGVYSVAANKTKTAPKMEPQKERQSSIKKDTTTHLSASFETASNNQVAPFKVDNSFKNMAVQKMNARNARMMRMAAKTRSRMVV